MLMLTFILLILTIFSSCSSGIIDERKCIHKDNVTVTCNHIPVDILPRISKVRIADIHFVTDKVPVIINQINFTSRSWSRVEYLEINDLEQGFNGNWRFEDNCFGSLKALKELHIHILYLKIFEGTFIGLNKVTVLDLSDCARLKRNILLPALNGTYKLPKLQKLLLRNWNSYNLPYGFDETFVQTLLPRKVTHLDISSTHISLLNYSSIFKNLRFLEIINISYANIEEVLYREPEVNGPEVNGDEMKHVRVFDLSYSTLPRQFMSFVPAVLSLSNININFSRLEGDFDAFLSTAESFNFSGIIPQYTSIYIELMKLTIDVEVKWSVKDLILRQNNLKSLDIQCFCDNYTFSSIEELDISDNGLEFIHPTFLYCMSNVEKINLAKNRLFKMRNGNRTVFEKLFLELNYLKYITLSANGLYDIPVYTFTKCRNIEVIDLSNNRLNQVTFILNGLERLQILDLQNNRIKMLDKISINRLNFLWAGNKSNEFKAIIVLRSNPLSCSDCSTKSFIKWLTSQMSSALVKQNLTCTSENENKEIITEQTRSIVQKICDREAMIISSAVSTAGLVSVVIILALFISKRRKRLKKVQNRAEIIDLLRHGQGRYEFMTFLSFSSDDEEFVEHYILRQMNEHLQRVTGIDRKLVCTGDRYFRPGLYVHDELNRCLDSSSVVVVEISNNFCASEYCCRELDQACVKGKSVLLMFIEVVEVEMMTQRMKELYDRNVRLLWTRDENGEYTLKTTWENASESILDLMGK